MIAGIDIGNGFIKAKFDDTAVKIPSGCVSITNPNCVRAKEPEYGRIIVDIFNEMDLSFESPCVTDKTRKLFGKRALMSGSLVEEFDVTSRISKSMQNISAIFVLATIAGAALKKVYNHLGHLPTDIKRVNVSAALSLPINEYLQTKEVYVNKFLSGSHFVTFHNFEKDIKMEITFDRVDVLAEGEAAVYAIRDYGEPLMKSLLADLQKRGFKLEGITPRDVLDCNNLCCIDIGEGTVNFPVFSGGRFNTDASVTYENGYGYVLEKALNRLATEGYTFKSRKELSEFLNSPENALNKKRKDTVKGFLKNDLNIFVNEIIVKFRQVISRVGTFIDVIYVYGGGATPLEQFLYPALLDLCKESGLEAPVLYLDSRYSDALNACGLFVRERDLSGGETV